MLVDLLKSVGRILTASVLILGLVVAVPFRHIDPALSPYYNMFMEEFKGCPARYTFPRRRHIVKFVDKLDNAIAVCYRGAVGFLINVDRNQWNALGYDDRYTLLMHELSHCFLEEEHTDENARHYMNPYLEHQEAIKTTLELREVIAKKCHK